MFCSESELEATNCYEVTSYICPDTGRSVKTIISFMLWANLCVTCGIWYFVCSVFFATCPDPFMIYQLWYLCSMYETVFVMSKNPFACFNSLLTWAKLALPCVNSCCAQFAMLYLQNHSSMLEIICGIRKIICGIGRFTSKPGWSLLLSYF